MFALVQIVVDFIKPTRRFLSRRKCWPSEDNKPLRVHKTRAPGESSESFHQLPVGRQTPLAVSHVSRPIRSTGSPGLMDLVHLLFSLFSMGSSDNNNHYCSSIHHTAERKRPPTWIMTWVESKFSVVGNGPETGNIESQPMILLASMIYN